MRHHQSGDAYLEPQQDAHVPRRPVIERVHQIFVLGIPHALVLQVAHAHSQVVTVLLLGIKHTAGVDDALWVIIRSPYVYPSQRGSPSVCVCVW